jgi:hypothetical protein
MSTLIQGESQEDAYGKPANKNLKGSTARRRRIASKHLIFLTLSEPAFKSRALLLGKSRCRGKELRSYETLSLAHGFGCLFSRRSRLAGGALDW